MDNFWARFGSGLGSGLGQGINETLDIVKKSQLQKVLEATQEQARERERVREAEGLGSLLPTSNQDILRAIAGLNDPQLKRTAIENLSAMSTKPKSLLGTLGFDASQQSSNPLQSMQNRDSENVSSQNANDLTDLFVPRIEKRKEKALGLKERQQQIENELANRRQVFAEENAKETNKIKREIEKAKTERAREGWQKKFEVEQFKAAAREKQFEKELAHDMKKFEKQQEIAEQKELKKQQEASHKETKKYYDQTLAAGEAAKLAGDRLSKMEKLIDKGNLPVSGFYKLFKNLEEKFTPGAGAGAGSVIGGGIGFATGGPIGAAVGSALGGGVGAIISPIATMLRYGQRQTSPGTEEFEKLSADFIRDVKSIFGNRITNLDLEAFLKSIPTLDNSDLGKKAIIRNMKQFNKGIEARIKVMKDIVQEHNGKRPYDLQLQVEERVAPMLDRIAKDFSI